MEDEKTTAAEDVKPTEKPATADPVPEAKPVETPAAEVPAAPKAADPFSSIGADLLHSVPQAQPHFVEKMKNEVADETAAEKDNLKLRDKNGHYFNPSIHQADKDGTPRFTVKGLFVMRKGCQRSQGKKRPIVPGEATAAESVRQRQAEETAAAEAESAALAVARIEATAAVVDAMYWQSSAAFFGADLGQPGADEQTMTRAALTDYFTRRGGAPDLPPGLALCFAFSMPLVKRFRDDRAAPKRQRLKEWFAIAWLRLRGKKRPAKVVAVRPSAVEKAPANDAA